MAWWNSEKTCALGAAAECIGHQCQYDYLFSSLAEKFPVMSLIVLGPVVAIAEPVQDIIWKLNDTQGWTREEIADWVETIEPQEQEQTIPARYGNIGEFTPVEA
jgi:hypothetical protein